MIDFQLFNYAGPPRTGTTWMAHAMYAATGVETFKTHVHVPWTVSQEIGELRVTTVRHPLNWLASYYREIHSGSIGVPVVDRFAKEIQADSFSAFVRDYLDKTPGQVGRIFDSYSANICLRVEDFPHNLIELLRSLGIPYAQAVKAHIPAKNTAKQKSRLAIWNPALLTAVAESERDTMERFGYELRDLHSSSVGVQTSA